MMLEMCARGPLWRDGLNYLHGTGHGIGAYLNVHEGPFGVGGGAIAADKLMESAARMRMYMCPIDEGFYLSDEPGFYLEGAFGIRLESDLVTTAAPTRFGWGSRKYLGFRYLSPVPMTPALIDVELLSPAERSWLNGFHASCRELVTPELLADAAGKRKGADQADVDADVARALEWLRAATEPL